MTLHLLRHELRRHRLLYPLAALLIFCAQFLPGATTEGTTTTLVMLVLMAGAVIVHLIMGSHPWNDDRAFWRTRPIHPRQLLAGQSLAIALVILLPMAAGVLLRILPLNLGLLAGSLAIFLPMAVALTAAAALATCSALAKRGGRPDPTPYLAAFVAPLLSLGAFGFVRIALLNINTGPKTGGEILTSFLCTLAVGVGGTLAALLLGTLKRRRRAAIITVLVAGISMPWIAGLLSIDLLPKNSPPPRTLGARIAPATATDPALPRWTGLEGGEFFAPRIVHASWTGKDGHVAWTWPRNNHRPGTSFQVDLLQPGHSEPLQDQHNQFACATDVPALWAGIRARLPDHSIWRPSETSTRFHEPLLLGDGPDRPRFSLSSDGEIYTLEEIGPLSPIVPGRLASPRPGRIEIRSIATDESRIAMLLRTTTPSPSLCPGLSDPPIYSTSPPEFWAVLLHQPSSTAYACHGLLTRLRHNGNTGMIIHTRHHTLTFELPRLETQLLGLDPKLLLAESTLHLFQAVPVARAEAKLDQSPAG